MDGDPPHADGDVVSASGVALEQIALGWQILLAAAGWRLRLAPRRRTTTVRPNRSQPEFGNAVPGCSAPRPPVAPFRQPLPAPRAMAGVAGRTRAGLPRR